MPLPWEGPRFQILMHVEGMGDASPPGSPLSSWTGSQCCSLDYWTLQPPPHPPTSQVPLLEHGCQYQAGCWPGGCWGTEAAGTRGSGDVAFPDTPCSAPFHWVPWGRGPHAVSRGIDTATWKAPGWDIHPPLPLSSHLPSLWPPGFPCFSLGITPLLSWSPSLFLSLSFLSVIFSPIL